MSCTPSSPTPTGNIVFRLEGASMAPVLLNRQPGRDLPRQTDGPKGDALESFMPRAVRAP